MLLTTRRWVLQKHFHVDEAKDLASLEVFAERNDYDLLILCHTLSGEDLERAIELVRRRSAKTQFLRLLPPIGEHRTGVGDQTVTALDGPQAMLTKVFTMVDSR